MEISSAFPKGPINQVKGTCIILKGDDIDTDRIIPARFLKCINFNDLGAQVFSDDRKEKKGSHPFDIEANQGSSILVVNKNFGCGSSREHAPQALLRWGIKGIIGESFAEIFYGNCLSLGIPCAKISDIDIISLHRAIRDYPDKEFGLDIKSRTLKSNKQSWEISLEKGSAEMLITGGWDATSILISERNKIQSLANSLPYLNNFDTKNTKDS